MVETLPQLQDPAPRIRQEAPPKILDFAVFQMLICGGREFDLKGTDLFRH